MAAADETVAVQERVGGGRRPEALRRDVLLRVERDLGREIERGEPRAQSDAEEAHLGLG